MRALGALIALVLAFGAAVMIAVAIDIGDTATCEDLLQDVASGEVTLQLDDECFDGSSAQKAISVVLAWAERRRRRDRRDRRADVRFHRHQGSAAGPDRRRCGRARHPVDRHRQHLGGVPAPSELAPAYLLAGDDQAKLDAALAALRARAESEGGPGALESFGSDGPPDADALIASIPALSLTATRRYLLADGVERWTAAQAKPVIAALGSLPPDLTVVLIAREGPPKAKAPKALAEAVEATGGEVRRYEAPRARDLPGRLVAEARRRGFDLEPDAARLLVERIGDSTTRLQTELDRLALWAGEGGSVAADDLEAMIADTSEEVVWALSDAIVDRDRAAAAAAAARLTAQGESVTPLVYQTAKRLREARLALAGLEAGRSAKELEASLPMHPYAAKLLLRRVATRARGRFGRRRAPSPTSNGGPAAAPTTRTTSRWRSPWRAPAARATGEARRGRSARRRRRRGRARLEPSCGRRCRGGGRPSARPCRSSRRACDARRRRRRRRRPRPPPRGA